MKVNVSVSGKPAKKSYWDNAGFQSRKRIQSLTIEIADSLQSKIKKNLELYRDTGATIEAVKVDSEEKGSAIVYSDHPGQWRLEMGFVGQDSLGRTYNQEPRPAWRPAIQEVKKELPRRLRRIVKDALK